MNRWLALGVLLATGVALGLRCPRLDIRPMHNDEAVNAIKFGGLWEQRTYRYDPHEFHGPLLAYSTALLAKLSAAPGFNRFSEARLRAVTVLFGVGLILLLVLLRDALGDNAVIVAALLTAVSPAFVFYSRYYIHEMLLVFSTLLLIAAAWRYWRSRKIGWALLAGLGLGLMDATKETFVLNLISIVVALGCGWIWQRLFAAQGVLEPCRPINRLHIVAAVAVWLFVAILLFSSCFTNFRGIIDSVRTYGSWLNRAAGQSPHIYPWSFYFHRLLAFHERGGPFWSEAFIAVLAIVGAVAAFARHGVSGANAAFGRFLAIYTIVLAAAYSAISYKTPWCALGFWNGAILLGGMGGAVLLNVSKFQWARLAMRCALAVGMLQLAAQAWQASADEKLCASPRNPYVFAQTSPDLLQLVAKVEAITSAQPTGKATEIKVLAPENDYWPLPWYLRGYSHVLLGGAIPSDPYAPLMIVSSQFNARLDDNKTHLMVGIFEMRPSVFFELYVELNTWKNYLAKNPPRPERE
jgi:uncharacterized protein (TIGR03663 family)